MAHGVGQDAAGEQLRAARRAVAPQVEFETKIEAKSKAVLSYVGFKRLVSGAFRVGLIGSSCSALQSCGMR